MNEKFTNGPINFEQFSDKDLYAYCKKVGYNARIWNRRFIATIPEVAKRRLYKKYGYCSIREFASKLAGVSHDNVEEVLRVSDKFKELPKMKELIGEVGLSKLRVVACVANKENEKELSEKVRKFTKSSLEIYVREKFGKQDNSTNQNLQNVELKFLPGEELVNTESVQIPQLQKQIGLFSDAENIAEKVANSQNHDKRTFTIQIDEQTEFELRKFKQKLEKDRKEPVDWNTTLKEMAKRATNEQKVQPKQSVKAVSVSDPRTIVKKPQPTVVSRYIPAKLKQEIQQKHQGHCAYCGCNKPAEQIHHPDRFAKNKSHENLVPLCKIHHDYIHQSATSKQYLRIDYLANKLKTEAATAGIG